MLFVSATEFVSSDAFVVAFGATLKVFAMGAAGYWLIWKGILPSEKLGAISILVGTLTLPCLIFHRFAVEFDPQTLPFWWVLALVGVGFQAVQVVLGVLLSRRLKSQHGRDEMTMLLGYQNAGFFVLPMLQALLPPEQFNRAAVLLFVFIIFFNASIWTAGTYFLLHQRTLNWRTLLLPPTLATLTALILFGPLRPFADALRPTLLWSALIGDEAPGAIELVGNMTVPLATLVLGGTIAQTAARGWKNFPNKRVAGEIAFWKLAVWPLVGWMLITFWPTPLFAADQTLRLLVMLQFAAPPAMNVAVFCQQYNYPMRLTPAASFLTYALCTLTVPFWVALVL